jgi:predicted RecB family nuclease
VVPREEPPIKRFQDVLNEMANGQVAFANEILFYLPEGYACEVDLLERDDGHESLFGDFHYRVVEVKNALNVKEEHKMQATFCNHVLGKIQDTFQIVTPSSMGVGRGWCMHTMVRTSRRF